jgi:poly-gamma-glutamate synthesis protein (capsule biosynthesis protein)
MRKKALFAFLVAVLLMIAAVWWGVTRPNRAKAPLQLRGSRQNLTIAATGDWLTNGAMPFDNSHSGFAGVTDILKNASLGLTNLEVSLLDPNNIPLPEIPGTVRWPYGTIRQAEDMRRLGMTVISLANNRAMDYGVAGMKQTQEVLHHVGLLHAGSGNDLQQAGALAGIGAAPRRVAVIAVTTSAAAESRATYAKDEILGRPGVNAIRYSPDVTVDAATFATLKNSAIAAKPAPGEDPNELTVSGTVIKKGPKTVVTFTPDERDVQDVLARVKAARSQSDVVVVMLHSHEPSNLSETPAEFVRTLARALIDAGASFVVGSGPHQLRRIEVYKQGVILYSLGNFAVDYSVIASRAADVYDSGVDLYQLALGALGNLRTYPAPQFAEPVWWESVIATATYDQGNIKSLLLQPIDLGVDLPISQRGLPQIAAAERGNEILQRLVRLSQGVGTQIRVENGQGVIDLSSHNR